MKLSKHLMIDGLLFIWVEKEIISEVIKHLETQDMLYVENVCWVMLDETKRKGKNIINHRSELTYFDRGRRLNEY